MNTEDEVAQRAKLLFDLFKIDIDTSTARSVESKVRGSQSAEILTREADTFFEAICIHSVAKISSLAADNTQRIAWEILLLNSHEKFPDRQSMNEGPLTKALCFEWVCKKGNELLALAAK